VKSATQEFRGYEGGRTAAARRIDLLASNDPKKENLAEDFELQAEQSLGIHPKPAHT
jgi:hypothetical protein